MAAAKPNPAIGVYAQGAGRVDIARAVKQPVTTAPSAVSFGRQDWPHADDQPIAKAVTYHNAGTAPVTLDLTLHTTGPDGKPTAAGLFTVHPSTITVPAGGDTAVTVTADTRKGTTDGNLGGHLTATAGDATVQTPVAVVRDIEAYDLTMKIIDRTGQPSANYDTMLFGLDAPSLTRQFDPRGTLTVRLPKGRYSMSTFVTERSEFSMLVQPVVTVDRAQTVTVDARTAKPIAVTVPNATADLAWGNLGYTLPGAGGLVGTGLAASAFEGIFTAQVGPATAVAGLVSRISGQWGQPGAGRNFLDSPFQYQLMWPQRGSFPTGFRRAVARRDLATVHKDTATSGARWGLTVTYGRVTGGTGTSSSFGFRYELPKAHVEYYNAESGVDWTTMLVSQMPATDPTSPFPQQIAATYSPYQVYRPGRTYREKWNRGVFGPVLPARDMPSHWITRTGDTMVVAPPAYGDDASRAGYSRTTTSSVTVAKDGVQVGVAPLIIGQFTVPAAAGRYQVVQEGNRGAPFTLSTKVRTEWTFRSGHVDGTTPTALAVSVVRFAPALDADNKAPADCVFAVPVKVQHQPGSAAATTRSLDLRASYDDGQTWTRAVTLGLGDNRVALLRHPAGGGFVSLKAKAVDAAGNTVEQTIIRAYRF